MAASADITDLIDIQADLTQFATPCYTYVLKVPIRNWQSHEKMFQRLLVPRDSTLLYQDEIGRWLDGTDPNNDEQRQAVLSTYHEERYYGNIVTKAAHNAAIKFFQLKQGTPEPACSIYAQAEIGALNLHAHVVMGGPGLSRYNAKSAVGQLAVYFLNELHLAMAREDAWLNMPIDKEEEGHQLLESIISQKWAINNGAEHDVCTVLQYKARNGGEHAARVNGPEYIMNYLLCKNARYYMEAKPELNTLPVDWFEGAGTKTYMSTMIGGNIIPLGFRKKLFMKLRDIVLHNKSSPQFGGTLFGDLPEVGTSRWSNTAAQAKRMTKKESLMVECLKLCAEKNLLTYEDLVCHCNELLLMLESTGGTKLVEQVLGMTHIKIVKEYTPLTFMHKLNSEALLLPDNKIITLFNLQGYNALQFGHWLCMLLDKKAGKQNSLCFYGPASTGKTNVAKAIVNAVKLYGCVNHQNKNFIFNDCSHKLVVWWEEALMHQDWVEQAKCILGGTEFRIDRKHRDSMLLPTTPVIISTNNDIYQTIGGNTVNMVHAKPIKERVVQLNFMKQLPPTFGEIEPWEVQALVNFCKSKFKLDLDSFYTTWKIDKLDNSFPLQQLCSGCSQDLTVFENAGFCIHCGGYSELETYDIGAPVLTPQRPSTPASEYFNFDWGSPKSWAGMSDSELYDYLTDSDEAEEPSTSAGPPKKRYKSLLHQILQEDSGTSPRKRKHTPRKNESPDGAIPERSQEASEQEQEPSQRGLNPSQWGERLGLINVGQSQPPIVLHCFESMPESDNEQE